MLLSEGKWDGHVLSGTPMTSLITICLPVHLFYIHFLNFLNLLSLTFLTLPILYHFFSVCLLLFGTSFKGIVHLFNNLTARLLILDLSSWDRLLLHLQYARLRVPMFFDAFSFSGLGRLSPFEHPSIWELRDTTSGLLCHSSSVSSFPFSLTLHPRSDFPFQTAKCHPMIESYIYLSLTLRSKILEFQNLTAKRDKRGHYLPAGLFLSYVLSIIRYNIIISFPNKMESHSLTCPHRH